MQLDQYDNQTIDNFIGNAEHTSWLKNYLVKTIKIYVLCPDTNSRHGGIKKLYRHVDVLNKYGLSAYILHESKNFKCDWFENNTKVAYVSEVEFSALDYLVIPEIYGPNIVNIARGVKKVIFNQNSYYSFEKYSLNKNELLTPYTDNELEAVLVVSEDNKEYLKYIFPQLKVFRIHNGIDTSKFTYTDKKKKLISFMGSKQPGDVLQLINILKFRGVFQDFSLELIANKSETEVSSILQDSLIFLWFTYQEGWPLPPAEAMACGSIVIGYHGFAGQECLNPEFTYPIPPADIINFAQTVEEVIRVYNNEPHILLEKAKKAASFIQNNHCFQKEEYDIISAWKEIINTSLQCSQNQLVSNLDLHEASNTQSTNVIVSYTCMLSIIVPWWDHIELLEIWKNNITHLSEVEIIFVDNGSNDQNKLKLQEFCKINNIKLIRNEENKGFSAANNQGAEIATGKYILFLNNDIEILDFPAQLFCNCAGNGIAGPGFMQNELGELYLEGWALCIKQSTLKALQGWCEDYGPGYWDDVDLSCRARLAGYSLTPIPEMQTFMRHKQNTTGRDGRLDQLALHVRNRGIFINKFYSLHPKIVVDSVFFQLYQTGIARVWKSLLEEWASSDFGKHLIVIDRVGTAPKIPGIRYRFFAAYDYNNAEGDREMLQQVCDEEGADVFISSYYTTPVTTPSVFMAHDMIPEVFGWDLRNPMWREKHYGIKHASAYIAVSENTAHDLVKCFPSISLESITIAKNGVEHQVFYPAPEKDINSFKIKYGISKPYFILVGAGSGYKNSILFFQAFSQLASSYGFDIVCTGSGSILETEFRAYTSGSAVHMLQLSDQALATAYSGAIALIYPSKYEGFGLPIVEAMACGCPVITCANSSIPEVAGKAAIYVKDNDVDGLVNALFEVQKPSIRNALIAAGLDQVKQFSWSNMAQKVSSVLIETTLQSLNLKDINLIIFPDWLQSEEVLVSDFEGVIRILATHPQSQYMTLIIDISNSADNYAEFLLSAVSMNLLMQSDLDISEGLEISFAHKLGNLQWQAVIPRLQGRIALEHEDKDALRLASAETLQIFDLQDNSFFLI